MTDQELAIALLNNSGPLAPVNHAVFIFTYYYKKLPNKDRKTAVALLELTSFKRQATIEELDEILDSYTSVLKTIKNLD